MVSYSYYNQVEDTDTWVLGEDRYVCAATEMIPPFGWRLTVHDDTAKTFTISDVLAKKFAATVAKHR